MKYGVTELEKVCRRFATMGSLMAAVVLLSAPEEARAGTDVVFAGTSSGRIHEIDIDDGVILWTRQIGGASEETIHALKASEDGFYLVVGSGNAVALFSTQGSELFADPVGVGDGLRCVGGGIRRLGVTFANADGLSISGPDIGIRSQVSPGDTAYYQVWYRNPVGTVCGNGFNLSNGVAILWEP